MIVTRRCFLYLVFFASGLLEDCTKDYTGRQRTGPVPIELPRASTFS